MQPSNYKIIFLSVLGSGLEYFDFTIYALFAPYISLNFFPHDNAFVALMNTFAIFALGYFARPLGGILLGHIGDRYGRKHAFTYAILVMAVATLLIGCLPSYNTIGIIAPILLLLLRLIQGLSLGGEVAGAITFTLEHYAGGRRGLMQAFIIVGMSISSAIAGFLGYWLIHFFTNAQMISWGWRILFFCGFFLGLVAYWVRKGCLETPAFLAALNQNALCKQPFITLCQRYPKQMLKGVFLAALSACFASFLLFSPTYLAMHAAFPTNYGFAVSSVGFLTLGLVSLLSGGFSDHLHYKWLFSIGIILTAISGYFVFHLLLRVPVYSAPVLPFILAAIALLAAAVAFVNGVYALAIADQFPTNVRYSGIGFCQNTSFALIGGTAPLIFTVLIHLTKSLMAPYYYLLCCAGLAFITILKCKPILLEKRDGLASSSNAR